MKRRDDWIEAAVFAAGWMIAGLILIGMLAGCARAPGLYATVEAGMQISGTSSAVLRSECHTAVLYDENGTRLHEGGYRSCGGDDPAASFSVGWEFEEGGPFRPGYIEYRHDSHYFDGHDNRETHEDHIFVGKKFGGR